jgi:hypothetical protein
LDEVLDEFPSADDLGREILRLRHNEGQLLDAVRMSVNGERFITLGPGPIGANKYKLGHRVRDD